MSGLGAWKGVAAVAVIALVAVASAAVYEVYLSGPQNPCQAVPPGGTHRSQLTGTTFGAVTEFKLPGPGRWPNAVTTAPDGSVWFAEQEVPGIAHLYPGNGTLVEYAWPGYRTPKPPDCVPSLNISGMAVWDGRVWAADEFGNRTVGVNPGDGSAVPIISGKNAPFPYWLAAGTDGNLWFTSNNLPGQPARLGRIFPNMTLQVLNLLGVGDFQPFQLDFVNSTFALLSTLNEGSNSTTHACVCTGRIYSFDPGVKGTSIAPAQVGAGHTLILPTGVSFSNGSVWVAQHGASSLERYDFHTQKWTTYPTSRAGWIDVTLPLVVQAAGGRVWFNEHYANRIAALDPAAGTLTEYSESNPPPTSYQGIQNDLSMTASPAGVWFTSLSGNYVGFVDGKRDPGFHVSAEGTNAATVPSGGSASFGLMVSGAWSTPLSVNASDSENLRSAPRSIAVTPSATLIRPGGSGYELTVEVAVGAAKPGTYTVAVTLSEGLALQTAYLFVTVT